MPGSGSSPSSTLSWSSRRPARTSQKKEFPRPPIPLAQDEQIQQLIARFEAGELHGRSVAELEVLVRGVVFQWANALLGWLLQQAADRADEAYRPKAGQRRQGRETIRVQGIFGHFALERDYYHHAGKAQGHFPADAALGLEVGYTRALAQILCLEGADETTYLKAERHLAQTGGIVVSARQIQRVVQRVGSSAQEWQQRQRPPGTCHAPVLYVSADGTGVPMVPAQLKGRRGKQADGTAKTRQAYLGCVFTQHRTDEQGHPVRDHESTTYVSSFQSIDEFGPLLRREAIGRGMGSAGHVVLLIDGAAGLENMGRQCFKDSVQIVDFYHAMEHAGRVIEASLGKTHPDYEKQRRRWAKRLLQDKVESLIGQTRRECAGDDAGRGGGGGLGLFRAQRQPDAIRHVPGGRLVHRLGRGGSRLQDRDREPLQTIGHVLVTNRRGKHPGLALHSQQPPHPRLLAVPPRPTRRAQRPPVVRRMKEEFCLTPTTRQKITIRLRRCGAVGIFPALLSSKVAQW